MKINKITLHCIQESIFIWLCILEKDTIMPYIEANCFQSRHALRILTDIKIHGQNILERKPINLLALIFGCAIELMMAQLVGRQAIWSRAEWCIILIANMAGRF